MPVYIIRAPNGQDVEMTSERPPTDEQKAAIFKEAGLEARNTAATAPNQPTKSGDGGALAMKGVASGVPLALKASEELGTNPNVARGAATAGRAVGALTSLPASLSGFGSMQKGAYAGGRAGYFTGKMVQDIARPVATALEKLTPYAQAVSTASGAQGALDLAQMAEPNRQDIGFLGMAGRGSAADQAAVIGAQIKALTAQGMKPGDAARTVYNAWAKQLREQTK